MTTNIDLHIKALSSGVELALISGVVSLGADILWLVHDVVANGMSVVYGTVGFGLIAGVLIAVYALYKIHTNKVNKAHKSIVLRARKERAKSHKVKTPPVIQL